MVLPLAPTYPPVSMWKGGGGDVVQDSNTEYAVPFRSGEGLEQGYLVGENIASNFLYLLNPSEVQTSHGLTQLEVKLKGAARIEE